MVWGVCQAPALGYDLARYQLTQPAKSLPWVASVKLGIKWGIAKTWHGRWFQGTESSLLAGARDAGVRALGRYAWLLPDEDISMQAGAWCDPRIDRLDLPLMIDWEHPATKLRGRALVAKLDEAIQRVSDRLGKRPLLYTGQWYWDSWCSNVDSQIAAECPLVLAAYPRKRAQGLQYREAVEQVCAGFMPAIPLPWKQRGLQPVIWQFDGDGGLYLPGEMAETKGLDVDVNIADWPRLCALADIAPDTVPETPTGKSNPNFTAVREPIALETTGPATPLGWADRAERDRDADD